MVFEFTATVLRPDGSTELVPCSASEHPEEWTAADLRHVLHEVCVYLGLDGPILVASGWRDGGLLVEIGDGVRSATLGPLAVQPDVLSDYHRDTPGDLYELDVWTVH